MKLNETTLPTMVDFYDRLREKHISQTEYDQASKICQELSAKLSDIYLKSDVLLLTDIFENYRSIYLRHYKLDPAQCYTIPSLSWYAMLRRYTSVELELFIDIIMLHFSEMA